MSILRASSVAAVIAAAAIATACTAKDDSTTDTTATAGAPPREVVVRARDFAFDAPDTITAGPTTFRLINEGPDFHHVTLLKIESGHTASELTSHMASGATTMPSWALEMGGPNSPPAGGESNATLDLVPGEYVMLCVIPGMADGKPHFMSGMVRNLTVVAAPDNKSSMPAVERTMRLNDYTFVLDQPLVEGRNAITVVNAAAQSHEVVFVKLELGKTAADFLAFMEKPEGPLPGQPVGGTTTMAQGVSNHIVLNLERGNYAMICFVPDAKDEKPHFVHGMVQEFRIQ